MEKWEYLTIELTQTSTTELDRKGREKVVSIDWNAQGFSEQLNLYGQQGWELVSVFTTEGWGQPVSLTVIGGITANVFATLKRPKP